MMLASQQRKTSRVVTQYARRRMMSSSGSMDGGMDLFNPTYEHLALRETLQGFVENEVEPQAIEFNRNEKLNVDLFKKAGELGLLGITVPEEYGGSGMDATAAVIAHEELASSDPGFCLSYLAHSMLFANNVARNGTAEQCLKYLPKACTGEAICGMGMSEPATGTDVLGMRVGLCFIA